MEAATVLSVCCLCIYTVAFSLPLSSEDVNLAHSAVLDSDEKYHVFWNFDENTIVFEVQVQTLGYIGFGLSPNGDMPGSDIVIAGIYDEDNTIYFKDRHATARQEPVVDESQDWHLVSGSQNDTHTTMKFWRKLDTCDESDRRIRSETARVIWAYNDEDADSTGTISYHFGNRGSKSILLLNPQKIVPDMPEDSIVVDFLHNKIAVPSEETTYWCEAFAIPEVNRKHHMIKIEPIIEPGNEWLVHHTIFYGCYEGTTNETVGDTHICVEGGMPPVWKGCISTIFAWAVGGGPFYLPEHVGFPFGFDGDPNLIVIQTHYDNPNLLEGLTDSSGFRLTLSPTLRKYDAGTLSTGMMVRRTQMIPPHMESFRSDGHCVPECLEQAMADHPDGINVFAAFLHSHLLGIAVKTRHFRNGIEREVLGEDDNYDFDFQESRVFEEDVNIRPGDHLVTECKYRSTGKTEVTYGGTATSEEMCLNVLMYYPRVKLSTCQSAIVPSALVGFADMELYPNLTVKEPKVYEGLRYYEALEQHVDWQNEDIRRQFQEYTTSYDHPVNPVCFGDRGSIYPANGDVISLPDIKKTLPSEQPCQTDDAAILTIQPMAHFVIAAFLSIWVLN